ncbi:MULTISPECIES: amidase [Idiomarina]|jgi:amidase/aspartyl-tRNA(Asn)/glutamyl-tRNA(Gln) amidotransferase subunit A|uniref:amidase n=1 Tax=Idiomarina TaxID=135575 RepID=UPI000C095F05|nr:MULTISPECIES: amidase [Idiomarina]MAC33382.1 amidase [Haliea sp.]MAO69149.1 amidase [Idiomarina sp.]MBF81754.1 amidase [Idiomarina sp.]|tara:strand:- start:2719 stop:4275 length:1557 start_codon:yes stop_codon:yes gene_type:complete
MRQLVAFLFILTLSACQVSPEERTEFVWQDASVTELQAAMGSGQLSAEQLTEYYLQRIKSHNRQGANLRAVNSVNKNALADARRLDKERRAGKVRGPLHGIPVLLKDNIDTADGMANTAGSLLFAKNYPQDNAFLVQQLHDAGAIILGKANLSEWANFRSTRSSSGWSAIGGQAVNPYDRTRSTCGSSSGSAAAVAADLTALAVGTETDGSLTCPAAVNGIVTIKPTLGLISRDGIIPIAHSQDTAGPMARSVTGAALMLDAMQAYDPQDPASYRAETTFASHLKTDGLKGKRIGVVRNLMGYNELLDAQFEQQLQVLKAQGAEVIDVEMPTYGDYGSDEFTVLLYEFKQDIATYLDSTDLPYDNLSDLIEANQQLGKQELALFGQELFEMANAQDNKAAYLKALKNNKRLAGKEGIDAMLEKHNLDVLIAPTTTPAWKIDHVNGDHYSGSASSPAAVAGYPHISVPMGYIQIGNEPALPVGMSFFAGARSEATLIEAAFAYEQATKHRRPPTLVVTD